MASTNYKKIAFGSSSSNYLVVSLLAVSLSTLLFLLLHKFGTENTITVMLLDRGWVPYVIVFFLLWCFLEIAFKYFNLVLQRKILAVEIFKTDRITLDVIDDLSNHLNILYRKSSSNVLTIRLNKALSLFRSSSTQAEMARQLTLYAEADANTLDASYTMLKVYVWAIPILGFIGTVIGISEAVGGFAVIIQHAQDIELIKSALGNVTDGLASAFDTTLLALVVSLLIMLPMSAMYRAESQFLDQVDLFCNEEFLPRLVFEEDSNAISPEYLQALSDSIVEQINQLQSQSIDDLRDSNSQQHALMLKDLKNLDEDIARLKLQMETAHQRFDQSSRNVLMLLQETGNLLMKKMSSNVEISNKDKK